MKRMRLFKRAQDTKTSVIRREVVPVAPPSHPSPTEPASKPAPANEAAPVYDGFEDSDVFLCENQDRPAAVPTVREVTLFVHGWSQVEPGLLSWTFQDLRSALDAVQRMKNAIAWCIVQGTGWEDLAIARASGKILVEQLA